MHNIRRARRDDAPHVSYIQKSTLPDPHGYDYANYIGREDAICLIAENGEERIGYVATLIGPPDRNGKWLARLIRPYITYVAVLRNHQNKGVCRSLITRTLEIIEEEEIGPSLASEWLYLECENELIPIYDKLGFETVSSDQALEIAGMRPMKMLMRRRLSVNSNGA